MEKQKVLFLCTGNSTRSQMAEAFLRKHAGDRYEVYSAGLQPKGINPYTIQVMEEVGIDLDQQTSKSPEIYVGKQQFDYVITVCDQVDQNCPIFPGAGARLHWSFEDPAALAGSHEEKVAKFRQVRDQIERRILLWLEDFSPTSLSKPVATQ